MNALIVVTPQDFERIAFGHERQAKYIPADKILFVGSAKVSELLEEEKKNNKADAFILKADFLLEDSLIPFDDVHKIMGECMAPLLNGQTLPRGITGWYYQQFLKMEYAKKTSDPEYMVWDGDTIPCGPFSMYAEDNVTPFLDVKQEFHSEYFDTINTLFPGTVKIIGPSFISEHMLIKTDIMKELIETIEAGDYLAGTSYWEKILRSIPVGKIQNSSFSEFETYGTYVAYRHPTTYRLREWHSFRLAGEFFDPNTICERDYEWLAKSFHAISFEKNQTVREDHKNLFDNPYYQEKLSAKQMLEVAQEEFKEGYKESWNILG